MFIFCLKNPVSQWEAKASKQEIRKYCHSFSWEFYLVHTVNPTPVLLCGLSSLIGLHFPWPFTARISHNALKWLHRVGLITHHEKCSPIRKDIPLQQWEHESPELPFLRSTIVAFLNQTNCVCLLEAFKFFFLLVKDNLFHIGKKKPQP